MFLGEDLLLWLLLALGGAMAVGNGLALIRPPEADGRTGDRVGELARPPLWRSLLYVALGLVAAVAAAGALLAG